MGVQFSGYDARTPHPRHPEAFAEVDVPEEFGLANDNARLVGELLGLRLEGPHGLIGAVSLPEARRAVIRARATFATRSGPLARPDRVAYGPPRLESDGTVNLKPLRLFARGASVDYLAHQVDVFARLVHALEAAGATHLCWS